MNDATRYILDAIQSRVWSGFDSPTDVHQVIDDLLEGDADEAFLRAAVGPEFARKLAAEATWPQITDCDRLDAAFEALNAADIVALQNTRYEMSDGLTEVAEALHARGSQEGAQGYCFYHGQDLEHAAKGEGLMLAFGSLDDDQTHKLEVGQRVRKILEDGGFTVQWNGEAGTRLSLPTLDWKRRGPLAGVALRLRATPSTPRANARARSSPASGIVANAATTFAAAGRRAGCAAPAIQRRSLPTRPRPPVD